MLEFNIFYGPILNGTCCIRSLGIDFVLVGEAYLTKYFNNIFFIVGRSGILLIPLLFIRAQLTFYHSLTVSFDFSSLFFILFNSCCFRAHLFGVTLTPNEMLAK